MTKTIVIGEVGQVIKKIPIKFDMLLSEELEIEDARYNYSHAFKYIELICRDYDMKGNDLMFAYDDVNDRSRGTLFIGKWNDGVVEEK